MRLALPAVLAFVVLSALPVSASARASAASGAAQLPAYDVVQSGVSDPGSVVPRQAPGAIVLGETIEGRISIRNAQQELVVQLNKLSGQRIEIDVEAGAYEVYVERPPSAMLATWTVGAGQRVEISPDQLTPAPPEPARGTVGPPSFAVAGRNRLEVNVGMWRLKDGPAPRPDMSAGTESLDFRGGFQYTRFVREDLAATFSLTVTAAETTSVSWRGLSAGTRAIVALPLGVRWYPRVGGAGSRAIRPYLAAGVGPVIGAADGAFLNRESAFAGSRTAVTIGGSAGAGVDVLLGRHWSLGFSAGYNWMTDFSAYIADRKNYSGFDAGVSFGWLWGKGY